jgi:DNA (cytosine-5)-methyltransferase 1
LFEGIGGFSLAASWMGWETVAWVENNNDCQKVLRDKFSKAVGHGDIRGFAGTEYAGAIDIITGGFPCQTFSLAGKGAVDLSLWKEMFRVIRTVKPRWVVAENVFGILARKKGYALEVVCSDLESEGYTVIPPLIIPACSEGAPHRRDRVWITAYSNSYGHEWRRPKQSGCQKGESFSEESKRECVRNEFIRNGSEGIATNTNTSGLQEWFQSGQCGIQEESNPIGGREPSRIYSKSDWSQFPTESPLSIRDDGLPGKLDRSHARLRTRSIKAGGNAIVPQVAFEIFKAIEQVSKVNF